MSNNKFKVGDRVRVVRVMGCDNNATDLKIGDVGRVVTDYEPGNGYNVKFDRPIEFKFEFNTPYYKPQRNIVIMTDSQLELIKRKNDEKIIIYRDGNEVIALDKATGKKGIRKCNPADTFDFNIGAILAFDRLICDYDSTIRVGDTVEIVDRGKSYTTYANWVVKHVTNKKDIRYFDYDNVPKNGMRGKVLHVAKHEDGNPTLAYVKITTSFHTYKCYLIAVDGLEKV